MAVESIVASAEESSRRAAPFRSLFPDTPTVTAFLGRTEKGPVNTAVELSTFDDYRRVFGGDCEFSNVPHTLQHYFQHGGQHAVVVRLANLAEASIIDVPAGRELLRLQARRPGRSECLRVSVDYDGVEHDSQRFNLVVQRLAGPGSAWVEDQELFPSLSIRGGDARFIVDALEASELVSMLGSAPSVRPDATRAVRPGDPIPYIAPAFAGTDGDVLSAYDIVGSEEAGTGLFALDCIDRVDLICIPPAPHHDIAPAAYLAATRYCGRRRALLLWDPPWTWRDASDALRGMREDGLASNNAITYFPRVRPRAEFARFPDGLPACGAIAGTLSCLDALCIEDGYASGDLLLRTSLTTTAEVDERQAAMLRRLGVNHMAPTRGGHVQLRGNACMLPQGATPTAAQRLDTRRTANLAIGALERGLEWVCSAPREPRTDERVQGAAEEFLSRLHRLELLAGATPEQAFCVKTTSRVAADDTVLRIGLALLRPAEFCIWELRFSARGIATRVVPMLEHD